MSKSGAVWHKALLKMLDKNEKLRYNIKVSLPHAGVMELADVADSKSAGATRTGSSPVTGTKISLSPCGLGEIFRNGRARTGRRLASRKKQSGGLF